MKTSTNLYTLALVALVALAGCKPTVKPARMLSSSDNGSTIELKVGAKIGLTLSSTPSRARHWELASLDEAVVKQVPGGGFEPHSKMVGSGGVSTWGFQAVAPGKAVIELSYFDMAAAGGKKVIDTFKVAVVVK